MKREHKFDNDDSYFMDEEITDTALDAFEVRREKARNRIDYRRLVEHKLEMQILKDELGFFSLSDKDLQ